MDIFEKCSAPSLAKELKEAGVYPYFHALQSRQDVEVQMEGKRRIMLGSNNYLGLTIAPDVVEAGIHALERYGTGCSGSRFLNGTLEMHLEAHPELPERLRALSLYARRGMTDRGLKIRESALTAPTPIIPSYTYETYHTLEVARDIYDRGVYVNPTLPPATPEGEALLRTSYMATHTEALLDEAMDIMADVLVKDHE